MTKAQQEDIKRAISAAWNQVLDGYIEDIAVRLEDDEECSFYEDTEELISDIVSDFSIEDDLLEPMYDILMNCVYLEKHISIDTSAIKIVDR